MAHTMVKATGGTTSAQHELSLAREAADGGDLDSALSIYDRIQSSFPNLAEGYSAAAAYLQRSRRYDDAERLLGPVLTRFATNSQVWIQYALISTHRRDWPTASVRWDDVRDRFPASAESYSYGILCLREPRRFDEAEALASVGLRRFPHDFRLLLEYSLLAHQRRDLPEALRRFAALREFHPARPEGYAFGVLTLRESERFDEAETLAAAALMNFPSDFRLLLEYGSLAHQRRDLPEALRRFSALRELYPARPEGYAFGVLTLRESKRFDEAEALAAGALVNFPSDFRLLFEYGWLARHRGDLPEAIRRFADLRQHCPMRQEGYSEGASALTKAGRPEDALSLLVVAADRLPYDKRIETERVRATSALKDWPEVLRLCDILRARFPDLPTGYFLAIAAMLRLGQFDEAERLGQLGRERFPRDIDMMVWSAKTATHRGDWATAMPRWDAALEAAPTSPMVIEGIALARQAMELDLADRGIRSGESPPETAPRRSTAAALDDPKFLLGFESLGDNCEFGLVQRFNGLEPLGLLRWSTTYANNLSTMLETRFEGVGDPENTTVDMGTSGEWHARDRRYFGMHTFIYDPNLDSARLARQMSRRFKFLRDKLLEDLQLAEKIFVYKRCNGIVADVELRRICAGLRSYGPNMLLYVRHPDDPEQQGTVVHAGEGLLVGYLKELTTDAHAVRGYREKWKALCRLAWSLAH